MKAHKHRYDPSCKETRLSDGRVVGECRLANSKMPDPNFWCSFSKHETWKHAYLREEFEGATICMSCQLKVVANVEAVVELPAVGEFVARLGRERHQAKKREAIATRYRERVAPDTDGWVYYIRINGRIKIGYTANLRQRSRNYPPGSELLAVEPGTRELEAKRHREFSRHLAEGREWFAESEALTEHIEATRTAHGAPQSWMHAYTKHEGIKHV